MCSSNKSSRNNLLDSSQPRKMTQPKCEVCPRFISNAGGKCHCGHINAPVGEKCDKNSKSKTQTMGPGNAASNLSNSSLNLSASENKVTELCGKLDTVLQRLDQLRDENSSLIKENKELKENLTCYDEKLSQLNEKISEKINRLEEMESRIGKLEEIENRISKLEDMESRIAKLEQANESIENLHTTYDGKVRILNELESRANGIEQYTRKNNVIIAGIPLLKNENTGEIVKSCAKAVGVIITEKDIDACHRLSPRDANQSPNIVVRLTRRNLKQDLIRKWKQKQPKLCDIGRRSDSRTYIEEHLSPRNAELYYKARCIRKEREVKYLWTSDCNIFARIKDGESVIRITSENDLKELEERSCVRRHESTRKE